MKAFKTARYNNVGVLSVGLALLAYCYLEIENNAARLNIPPGVALYVACITLLELRGAGPQRCKLCSASGLN